MLSYASSRRRLHANVEGYSFISPWLLGFFIFTVGPMLASLYFAFTDYRAITAPRFTGLANFSRMAADRYFLISLSNTAYYVFIGVPAFQLSALAMAMALNAKIKGTAVYRTIYYLPSVMPAVANAVLWVWIFNPDFGFANVVLGWLGLPPLRWLADPALAKPCFIIMGVWATGAGMLIYLAGLQGVSEALYEAAEIDGAGTWSRFRYVTVPMITPSIFFNLVIGFIGSFQVFTTAYVATGGGPVNATLFYVLYLYQMAFQSFWMGYASALAWVLFIIILLFTLVQLRLSRRWVYYEVA
jgi:multiple sugar transport system permease protein